MDGQWQMPDAEVIKDKIKTKSLENNFSVSENSLRQAVLDSIRALMLIRAYRIRGHLAATLDPLSLAKKGSHPELSPESYGFREEDLHRPIFIDNVLGLNTASIKEILELIPGTK